jgi:hypothetical protein
MVGKGLALAASAAAMVMIIPTTAFALVAGKWDGAINEHIDNGGTAYIFFQVNSRRLQIARFGAQVGVACGKSASKDQTWIGKKGKAMPVTVPIRNGSFSFTVHEAQQIVGPPDRLIPLMDVAVRVSGRFSSGRGASGKIQVVRGRAASGSCHTSVLHWGAGPYIPGTIVA